MNFVDNYHQKTRLDCGFAFFGQLSKHHHTIPARGW